MANSLFTIRKKKKEKHPQVVVGATRTSFDTVSLTHSPKGGGRTNIVLKNNPNDFDDRKAYLRKRVVRDFKFNFSKAFKNYHLSNEDIDELIKYLKSKKKK